MKKIINLLLIMAIFLIGCGSKVSASKLDLPEVTDHEKIVVNLFYGDGCHFCHNLLTYISENYDVLKDYIDIHGYETWSNKPNSTFLGEVKTALVPDTEQFGVPFMVIGDEYLIGANTTEFLNLIKKYYTDETYSNKTFESLLASTKAEIKEETYDEVMATSGLKTPESNVPDWLVITIILVVLVGGIGGLFFISRKK